MHFAWASEVYGYRSEPRVSKVLTAYFGYFGYFEFGEIFSAHNVSSVSNGAVSLDIYDLFWEKSILPEKCGSRSINLIKEEDSLELTA